MNRKVLLIGLAVTAPIVVVLAISFGRNPYGVKSPLVGKTAPSFALQNVNGAELVALDAFRGKPVVLNFWATWCVPCYAEHGVLTATAQRLGSDAQFIGVVYDDTQENILRFLQQYGSSYPTLLDESGKTAIAYGVYGVPETFFIDRNGTIAAKFEGPLDEVTLQDHLRKAAR
ncbi:MAG TPA: redoxin domain-containing protein [Thermoanaerobaculia bacterium]|nr:redoxin domain-containing protein [Thermoanaerobaculia bacterium]